MSLKFPTDDDKYQSLVDRDPKAEGEFIYCVVSTSIYCRPTCSSRLALQKNVIFCKDAEEAEKMKFKPCRRCKPNLQTGWNKARDLIKESCSIICRLAWKQEKLNINAIVSQLKISKWHFCRIFKNYTGMTPRRFYLKSIELNQNPIALNPLPLIETKRNLTKRKLNNKKYSSSLEYETDKISKQKVVTPEMVLEDDIFLKLFTLHECDSIDNLPTLFAPVVDELPEDVLSNNFLANNFCLESLINS